ncbi:MULTISPECIES: glycosyltransferase family 2 protein [unclassified Mesorhizobium]|uniref:glycosyltransferase family 2 protein n=1 Tax=unclassified Mesorhizobium TaxID=325217 RepID=UPI000BAFF76A|nr:MULTISPECIES: glycosyltransferase family 2 protein [unclassified Mesorhizobium]TGT60480.1 glycosyltransferase family 2 protein [Mesorhizobium sp. M00.F.Ca.ET.170.01.1.1]AZO10417.1 glycosyltransferase family 2 protein [Mesorhizobium sp. M3A.F.Ca.ET.080.04.2.1]PBB88163.1 dolichol-P-glucose synthetase [Mesorhizobium sp. WSM3876]RWB73588.1 MAG: glycosyltransferase family 2 protein [Mesorhizobium sp.]RWB91856.1 MAG: glycosyltransferase family 2 protein [Mesorhizobium sp.]
MNAVTAIRTASAEELELTILMPCLNEAETLATCIRKARAFLDRAGVAGEVLIADNGSSDGSQQIAADNGAQVVPVAQKGYGAALMGGIAAARGRYIIMGDADDSYDFGALEAFVSRLRDGADLVMGNRFQGGIEPGAMPVLHRYLGNPVLSFIGRLFFRIKTGDFHCGLRGFNAERIRKLDLQTSGMEFASEMVVRSALAGLRIEEVPTTLKPDGRSRPPHLRTWRDGWRHLKFLLVHNPRWMFFIPGTVLLSLGALLVTLLLLGPLQVIDNLSLDLNTFVAACFMVVVGVQLLTFGAISRYYAEITGILPPNRRSDWLTRTISTDRLAANAGICFAGGALFFGYALLRWASLGFGPLDDPAIPRVVVLGLSLIVISLQAFFSAFLLGVLEIPVKRLKAASAGSADDARLGQAA